MSILHKNLEALRLLVQINIEGRLPSAQEKRVISGYAGWGALAEVLDPHKIKHETTRIELATLVSYDDLESMSRSVLDAYYTPADLVSAMWSGLRRMGFHAGTALEPSVGTGAFLAEAPATVSFIGIEKDHVTARIAAALHPEHRIINKGFEDVALVNEQFDAACGNPPFGDIKINDALHPELSDSIHAFFIAKSIAKVRVGGVAAFVVSRYFMDAVGPALNHVAEHTRLVAAFRLPITVFKAEGAEVVTDVIFLQRVDKGQGNAYAWTEKAMFGDVQGLPLSINRWFIDHPDCILGRPLAVIDRYGKASLDVEDAGDWLQRLEAGVALLPENIFVARGETDPEHDAAIEVHDTGRTKVYGYAFDALTGEAVQRLPDHADEKRWCRVTLKRAQIERLQGMIGLRDALVTLLDLEASLHSSDTAIEDRRAVLKDRYAAFVARHGAIHAVGNRNVYSEDPDYPLIQGLELDYDPGLSAAIAAKEGVEAMSPSWSHADILSRRVITPGGPDITASNAQEALIASLRQHGRVDLPYMASLLSCDEQAILDDLRGIIFCVNPHAGSWQTRDQYLSGNVKAKLAQARERAKQHDWMVQNVEALEAVQPADIDPLDIHVPINAPWLPGNVVIDFIHHMIDAKIKATPLCVAGQWHIAIDKWAGNWAKNASQWGTNDRPFIDLYTRMMNNQPLTVYVTNQDGSRSVDTTASAAAEAKADDIRQTWGDWLWSDAVRRDTLARLYNDRFNTNVARSFDGTFLLSGDGTLPGMAPGMKPYDHQVNAMWRIATEGRALLDHVVGAGKTLSAIGAGMLKKSMGLIRKPAYVVPNHLVDQWASEFTRAYPNARVLRATAKDFEKQNRRKLFAKIATNAWDAVVMAHSSFEFIDMPADARLSMLSEMVEEISEAIQLIKDSQNERDSLRSLMRQKEKIEQKIKGMMNCKAKDEVVTFDRLGIDCLFIDEAQAFKNLMFFTGHSNIGGLGNPSGSGRAMDLFVKGLWLQREYAGRGLVLLTGTPISNSIVELYNILRYLRYDDMQARGLAHFDAWAAVFAQPTSSYELTVTGKYKLKTRFKSFDNIPELMAMYKDVADVVHLPDLQRMAAKQERRWPIPKMRGGKAIAVIAKRSPEQETYMADILKRGENLSNVDPKEDNMLKLFSDANKAALDMRLIYEDAQDFAGSKVNLCVANIIEEYRRWDHTKGAQMVFSDLGIPKRPRVLSVSITAANDEGDDADHGDNLEAILSATSFSVYEDIRSKLVAAGIPDHEIAFIHAANTDARKFALFQKVNRGDVRVLIGSTGKMGAGTNAQERLVALHHLDAPLRPSDVEQREGRILRQGSALYAADPDGFEVAIYRYGTYLSLDAMRWQILETKAKFIEQIRKGDMSKRSIEDVDGEDMANFAAMKAELSGNPLILKQFQVEHKLKHLTLLEQADKRKRWGIESQMRLDADIDRRTEDALQRHRHDLAVIGKFAALTFDDGHGAISGDALPGALARSIERVFTGHTSYAIKDGVSMGSINGLDLTICTGGIQGGYVFELTGSYFSADTHYEHGAKISTPGLITRLGNMLAKMPNGEGVILARQTRINAELATMVQELAKPFKHTDEITHLRKLLTAINTALTEGKDALEGEWAEVAAQPGRAGSLRVARRGDGGVARRPIYAAGLMAA